MRLKVTFKTQGGVIPINYQYQLCSFVYRRLKEEDETFTSFLHDRGYKGFKLFTFSQLFFDTHSVRGDRILIGEGKGRWYISSCNEEFVRNFFSALLEKPFLEIETVRFEIEEISILPEPEFSSEMSFVMLSPLVVSVPVEKDGKLLHKFLTPEDEKFEETLKQNLLKKYEAFYGEKAFGEFQVRPDWDYINRKGKITKLVRIKDIFVKGTVFPFSVVGDPKLIKFGYDVGFGEKNSLGFGMVEIASKR